MDTILKYMQFSFKKADVISEICYFSHNLQYISQLPAQEQLEWYSISNHIPSKVWDEITYPFPYSMDGPLKFWNRCVISSIML